VAPRTNLESVFAATCFLLSIPNGLQSSEGSSYAAEWRLFAEMVAVGALGCGSPRPRRAVVGADRVHQALIGHAEFLQSLHYATSADETPSPDSNEFLHTSVARVARSAVPYLHPVYDCRILRAGNLLALYCVLLGRNTRRR